MLALASLVVLVLYSLELKPEPRVYIDSSAYHPAAVYQAAANRASQSLKDRNKLTYDEGKVVAALKDQFAEISAVSISLPIVNQRPLIKINIDKPVFSLSSSGQDYVIDESGVVVPRGQVLTNKLLPITDTSGVELRKGDRLLSEANISFMQQVLAQLSAAKVAVSSINLPPLAQEFDLRTKDTLYFTKFFLGGDPLVQVGQMLASRADFTKKNIVPSQYLDVRVKGKIYYR